MPPESFNKQAAGLLSSQPPDDIEYLNKSVIDSWTNQSSFALRQLLRYHGKMVFFFGYEQTIIETPSCNRPIKELEYIRPKQLKNHDL